MHLFNHLSIYPYPSTCVSTDTVYRHTSMCICTISISISLHTFATHIYVSMYHLYIYLPFSLHTWYDTHLCVHVSVYHFYTVSLHTWYDTHLCVNISFLYLSLYIHDTTHISVYMCLFYNIYQHTLNGIHTQKKKRRRLTSSRYPRNGLFWHCSGSLLTL